MQPKITVPKALNDPNGEYYEAALFKAMYHYPKPDRLDRQDIHSHALNILEGEALERSIVAAYPSLYKSMNYKNVSQYLPDKWLKYKKKKITKFPMYKPINNKFVAYTEEREVPVFDYEYEDLIHLPTRTVIECKKYVSESSFKRHRKNLIKRSHYIQCDYILFAYDSEDDTEPYEITHVLSLTKTGQFRNHDLTEFFRCP